MIRLESGGELWRMPVLFCRSMSLPCPCSIPGQICISSRFTSFAKGTASSCHRQHRASYEGKKTAAFRRQQTTWCVESTHYYYRASTPGAGGGATAVLLFEQDHAVLLSNALLDKALNIGRAVTYFCMYDKSTITPFLQIKLIAAIGYIYIEAGALQHFRHSHGSSSSSSSERCEASNFPTQNSVIIQS